MSRLIPRQAYKQIEYWLYNYQREKRLLEEQQEEILHSTKYKEVPGEGRGRGSVTEAKALKLLAAQGSETAKWIKAVEITIERFAGTEKGRLIELYYLQEKSRYAVMRALNISEKTFYNWREEVVWHLALSADALGLLRVSDWLGDSGDEEDCNKHTVAK